MPSTSSQTRKTPASRKRVAAASRMPDAIKFLTTQHKQVRAQFKEYEKLCKAEADEPLRQALAKQICEFLTLHMAVEEELLYPPVYQALDEDALVDEAQVEHASAKDLIAQILAMEASDDLYDAKVTVLGEYIEHHVKEEEKDMFLKLRKTDLDLKEMGAAMQARADQLKAGAGAPPVH